MGIARSESVLPGDTTLARVFGKDMDLSKRKNQPGLMVLATSLARGGAAQGFKVGSRNTAIYGGSFRDGIFCTGIVELSGGLLGGITSVIASSLIGYGFSDECLFIF